LIKFSIFTSERPNRITKKFRLDSEGHLVKEPNPGKLCAGTVKTVSCNDLRELSDILNSLTVNKAVSWGICSVEHARVFAKDKYCRLEKLDIQGIVARTKEQFPWPSGVGILMLDYDPPKDEAPFTPDEFKNILFDLFPALANAPILIRPSASSYIYNNSTELKGPGGMRALVLVKDASDIPRAGITLFKQLWLNAYGHIEISKNGSLLVRSLIDSSVWQSNRLDFCAGACCEPPLKQVFPHEATLILNPDKEPLDSLSAIPSLSEQEEQEYKQVVNDAKAAKKPEAIKIREHWLEERGETEANKQIDKELSELPKELSEEERQKKVKEIKAKKPKIKKEIKANLKRILETSILPGDHQILLESGNLITVKELLENPDQYHDTNCADPLEPNYRDDHRIGWINLKTDQPLIWSHAHGEHRYNLVPHMSDSTDFFLSQNLWKSDFEIKKIWKDEGWKKRTGVGAGDLIKLVKQNRTEQQEALRAKQKKPEAKVIWEVTNKGIKILYVPLRLVLEELGFCNYINPKTPGIKLRVRVVDNVVSLVQTSDFQQAANKYILENYSGKTQEEVLEAFTKASGFALDESRQNLFTEVELEFIRDTRDSAFFHFVNGTAEITKNGLEFHKDRPAGVLWDSEIIKRGVKRIPHDFNPEKSSEQSIFEQFCRKISGYDERMPDAEQRFNNLCRAIGYMLHNYSPGSESKAVILTENTLDDNRGRTGKGLLMQAVGCLQKVTIIDGKNVNFNSSFVFQDIEPDTKIVFFDDVKSKKFDFENLYSAISEGYSVEKKNQQRYKIPKEDSPKTVVSSNTGIAGSCESDKARRQDVELFGHFNAKHTPRTEFGCEFFTDDWNADEWNRFYQFMFRCTHLFLEKGHADFSSETMVSKQLLSEVGLELVQYLDNLLFDDDGQFVGDNLSESETDKEILLSKYNNSPRLQANYLDLATFGRRLSAYCRLKGICVATQRYTNAVSMKRARYFSFRQI
jgi:hypothetical protein